jgi:CDP-glycerol glycerophosphotransferase
MVPARALRTSTFRPARPAAVKDSGAIAAQYGAAYQAFAAKYCPLDDGKAGARVCDRLFGR